MSHLLIHLKLHLSFKQNVHKSQFLCIITATKSYFLICHPFLSLLCYLEILSLILDYLSINVHKHPFIKTITISKIIYFSKINLSLDNYVGHLCYKSPLFCCNHRKDYHKPVICLTAGTTFKVMLFKKIYQNFYQISEFSSTMV